MKLVTFIADAGPPRIGALLAGETELIDLSATGEPTLASMLALIDAGEAGLDRARAALVRRAHVIALDAVRLLAPVPEPRQMRDFLSFEQHVRQARANRHLLGIAGQPSDPAKVELPAIWYRQPIYYKCNRFSVVGTGSDVRWPRASKLMDYELEFGVFVGRPGKDIAKADAHRHVFGYTIFNDFSARDVQLQEMTGQLGPAKGKDFDTGNAMGPWLVTADEIADPQALAMVARVNGVEWSRGSSAAMRHTFADIIAHVSTDETLHAGEFLGSGTVGSGCGLELGRFLSHGDVVELEVSGLGVLRNRVLRQDLEVPQ